MIDYKKYFDQLSLLVDISVNRDRSEDTRTSAHICAYNFKCAIQYAHDADTYYYNKYKTRAQELSKLVGVSLTFPK